MKSISLAKSNEEVEGTGRVIDAIVRMTRGIKGKKLVLWISFCMRGTWKDRISSLQLKRLLASIPIYWYLHIAAR